MGILMLNGNNYTGGVQQVYGKASGAIVSFDDGGDNKPLKSLKVAINPVQEGSGTPSPQNVRPLHGWTWAEIHRADGEEPHIIDDIYSITWSEAGTVYGGELDVVNGVLRVDRGGKVYDGTETWHSESTYNFYAPSGRGPTSQPYYGTNKLLCSHTLSRVASPSNPNNCYIATSGNLNIQFDSSVVEHTVSAFTAWLAQQYNNGTPLTISYELITPQEIQLTPTEVTTLLGINNIWSDTGNVEECVYQRDLNLAINELFSRVEALEQASGTMSLSLSKSAVKEEETKEETKEEEQNEDKR